MRKLILFLLICISAKVNAQVYQEMPQYGYRANRMAFDSTLQIPSVCGVPTLKSNVIKKSAIAYDTCNARFYIYNSKTLAWSQITGGTSGNDTTKIPYIGANKEVNLGAFNLIVDSLTIGRGKNHSLSNNTALGFNALFHTTTGNFNTSVGHQSLHNTTTGQYNTALGQSSLFTNTTGSQNTAIGLNSLLYNTTGGSNVVIGLDAMQHNNAGASNTAIGYNAGSHITNGATPNTFSNNSIYIGRDSKAKSDAQSNQIVIGFNAIGNGSNTVTMGNTSITANYFNGSINGGSFVKSGGTSSEFLKADGSVDALTYLTATDSVSLNNRINLKLNIADTTNMLSKYLRKTDTTSLSNRIDNKQTDLDLLQLMSFGIKAEPYGVTLANISSQLSLVTNRLFFYPFNWNVSDTLRGISFFNRAAFTNTASNYNGIAIYSLSGGTLNRIVFTANDGTFWNTAINLWKSQSITPTFLTKGIYFIAYEFSGTGTPTLGSGAPLVIASTQSPSEPPSNNNINNNGIKFSTFISNATATPPSSVAMSTTTAVLNVPYFLFY